jgi:hypothetical protein
MKPVIYLNRWGQIYHLMVVVIDGENEHRLHSRLCLSLREASRMVEQWRHKYNVADADVTDNSRVDMNELLKEMETDFSPAHN